MRKTIIEPFKIKMVEPLHFHSKKERKHFLEEAGFNLFLLKSDKITFDFLTDSGTTAMSAEQWASMITADESYAGSKSFQNFKDAVKEIMGYRYVIPTHQGRAAERIFFGKMVKEGNKIPSNNHFDTTRANIEFLKAEAVDLVIDEGKKPRSEYPFKGNIDTIKLEDFCCNNKDNIPFGMITITNNTGGGQPVSMENLKQVAAIYKKYNIPFIIDACRFAENAYFIKKRENEYKEKPITEIVHEIFNLADGCMMSAKKDAMVNIGGFIALKNDSWLEDLKNILILTEGFPTYGGLAARDLAAMAVGLYEVLDESYLEYRIAVCEYMAKNLNSLGIPTMLPAGGHAVYIDAKEFLPHILPEQFPGQSLAAEMYINEGIRSCEIGSAMFGKNASMELVRLAIPRRVYTQSHFDYILEGMEEIVKNKDEMRGMKITHEPPFLRHFTARFDYV